MKMYNTIYKMFQNGQISEKVWHRYCRMIMHKILVENRDVWVRLKNR